METTSTGRPAGISAGNHVAVVADTKHGVAIGSTGIVNRVLDLPDGTKVLVEMDANGATLDFQLDELMQVEA